MSVKLCELHRSASLVENKLRPLPPPRCHSTTTRRRRNVGERVGITSSSNVYFHFGEDLDPKSGAGRLEKDKNESKKKEDAKENGDKCEKASKPLKDVAKLKCKTVVGDQECQEVNLFLGKCSFVSWPCRSFC